MNEVVQLKRVLSDCADKLTEGERRGINVRLLLMYHLSTMLINMSAEIEAVMNRQGLFKMTIKHYHKKNSVVGSRQHRFCCTQEIN